MMRGIEGKDGLKPFLNDPDKAKSGLARTLVTAAKAWREAYGDLPLLVQVASTPGLQAQRVDLSQGNLEEQMLTAFGCSREQIARGASEITPDTKAYVGPLEKGIFYKLEGVEHVYTSFPEGKIIIDTLEIGGKSPKQLEQALEQGKINRSSYAEDMMHSRDFTTLKEPQVLRTVRLGVQSLALEGTPTTDQIYARGAEFDLDPCPAEAGIYQRLKDTDQPVGEWYLMAMKQITDRYGDPRVFLLGRGGDGFWLHDFWAGPDCRWHPEVQFVFRLRKNA